MLRRARSRVRVDSGTALRSVVHGGRRAGHAQDLADFVGVGDGVENRNETVLDVAFAEGAARGHGAGPWSIEYEEDVVQAALLRGAVDDVDDALAVETELLVAALNENPPIGDEVPRLLHEPSGAYERDVAEPDGHTG